MHITYGGPAAPRDELRLLRRPADRQSKSSYNKEAGSGSTHRRIVKRMATDGWLSIGWPTEYGRPGLQPDGTQFIFVSRCA